MSTTTMTRLSSIWHARALACLTVLTIGLVLASGCDSRRPSTGGDGGPESIGGACSDSSDCASNICVIVAPGEGRCSVSCTSDRMCPPDWRCEDVGGTQACACLATTETCNGIDDDCDTRVDEGAGAEIGCSTGEVCSGGACSCPAANVCGGECVDLETNAEHCGGCGNACPSGQCASGRCCMEVSPVIDALDLLFVIDNSGSMTEEQASLARSLHRLVAILTSGDANQDGDTTDPEDFVAITDLHVGVVTTDMGTGGFTVPTCAQSNFGDDAILRTQGRADITGCSASYPSFLTYGSGTDPSTFADDAICVANIGNGGCGFEQQLDAMLKAVSPAAPTAWTAPGFSPPEFHAGTSGHGDGANAGFLRADSTLAVVLLSDEEDCSARDPDIFNPASPTYGSTDLNLRCYAHELVALHPISRFVDGLLSLRPTPADVVFVPIVGVPPDLARAPGEPTDYRALVGPEGVRDERMVAQIDPAMPNRLVPSCNTANGIAFPPIRIVQVAEGLHGRGAGVTVQSICQDALDGPIDAFVRTLSAPRLSCD